MAEGLCEGMCETADSGTCKSKDYLQINDPLHVRQHSPGILHDMQAHTFWDSKEGDKGDHIVLSASSAVTH